MIALWWRRLLDPVHRLPPAYLQKCLLFSFLLCPLVPVGCRGRQSPVQRAASPPCTSYAMIRAVSEDKGIRFVELDTLQKTPGDPNEGAPGYVNSSPGFVRWFLSPDAAFTMQTLSFDSTGNFLFNQPIAFDTLRSLFPEGSSSRFRHIPFRIIHSDTIITSVSEEYIP